jgi:hypothetical protein
MPSARVVPTLNPGEDRQACLGLGLPAAPGNEFTCQTDRTKGTRLELFSALDIIFPSLLVPPVVPSQRFGFPSLPDHQTNSSPAPLILRRLTIRYGEETCEAEFQVCKAEHFLLASLVVHPLRSGRGSFLPLLAVQGFISCFTSADFSRSVIRPLLPDPSDNCG